MNWIEAAGDVLYSLTFNILIPREPRLKLCVLHFKHPIPPPQAQHLPKSSRTKRESTRIVISQTDTYKIIWIQ